MFPVFSLARLFLLSGFFVCVSIPAWAQSSEYGLLLLECTNLDGKKVELTIDVSESTANVMGNVVSVSEKNGVIALDHEKEGTILTLMPRIGKVSSGGKTMDCIFRDAQGTIVSGTIKQEEPEISEPEISEPEISLLSQGDSPIFDVFYVWDIRFSDFYGKNHLTPDEKYAISFERETKDEETIKEEREEGFFEYGEISVDIISKEERDRKWETIISILRKTADDIEYIVFACSSRPEWLDKGENEDCEGGDIVFKAENPFLPDDRVMVTLVINNQPW
jgi:hypothetical protein